MSSVPLHRVVLAHAQKDSGAIHFYRTSAGTPSVGMAVLVTTAYIASPEFVVTANALDRLVSTDSMPR